jgi:hypothetical protein
MEHNKVIISLKDGIVWTQIFDKQDKIVSSFVSDTEIEALTKTKKYLLQHKEYVVANKKLHNL